MTLHKGCVLKIVGEYDEDNTCYHTFEVIEYGSLNDGLGTQIALLKVIK